MLISLYHALGLGVKVVIVIEIVDLLFGFVTMGQASSLLSLQYLILGVLLLREVSLLIDTHIRRSGGEPTVKRLGDHFDVDYHVGMVDPQTPE